MSNAMQPWLERCAGTDLPVLGESARVFHELAANERLAMGTLAQALMGDFGLALKVFRLANEHTGRRLKSEVVNLEQAAMRVGVRRIAELAASQSRIDEACSPLVQLQLKRLYGRCLHTALLAEDWAVRRKDIAPAEVAFAALVYNLGGIALWSQGAQAMTQLLRLRESPGVAPHEAEYVVLGFGIESFGHALAQHWGLPRLAVESMQSRYAQEMRTLGVMLSAQLAHAAAHAWGERALGENARLAQDYLNLDEKAFIVSLNAVTERYNARAAALGTKPLPALKPEHLAHSDGAAPTPANPVFCLAPRADSLAETLQRLADGDVQWGDREGVIRLMLLGLRDGLGLNRAVFLRLGAVDLAAEALVGTDYEPLFNRLRIPLDTEHLFSVLMGRQGAVWLNADNRDTLWRQLPAALRETLGVRSFFAMSVFIKDEPYGMFYADRRGSELDAAGFEAFKRVIVRGLRILEKFAGVGKGGAPA